jgi:Holliday junction resolvase RusA-like endonuclease
MKRQYQLIAVNAIRRDLRGFKAKGRVQLNYMFGEPKKGNKRDFDNIVAAGRKIITDALVRTNILVDDSPRYLGYGTNNFEYVDVPYIRVEIVKIG